MGALAFETPPVAVNVSASSFAAEFHRIVREMIGVAPAISPSTSSRESVPPAT